ncbi:MAG TPA: hypothetical protein VHV49_14940 [Pseudonocardiaceae bacterium]|nr:hypothetical protein [Pseudonocardiaceae bacterium]
MRPDPVDIVEAGYDRIAEKHLTWLGEIHGDPRPRFLDDLMARLPERPAVLDLGCGAGVPCTARLAERSHDPATNRLLLADAGLTVQVDELVTMHEPEGPATFQWVIAKADR